jgi:hypothetical protein
MPQEAERPKPHGDPLQDEVEPNAAQRQSDAPPDAAAGIRRDELTGTSDRSGGRGSTANGVPAFDSDDDANRRRLYDEGADLVSRID